MTPTPSWSVNRRAGKAVVWNAVDGDDQPLRDLDLTASPTLAPVDAADAHRLLDMLGLIDGPGGRVILPDDNRVYDDMGDPSRPASNETDNLGKRDTEARRARFTTPPGLRTLQPPQAPATPPKAKPMPAVTPAPPSARSGHPRSPRQRPIPHGTTAGYQAHYRRKEPMCEPCRGAERKRKGQKQAARAVQPCGTRAAFQRHQRHGESPCRACADANNAHQRELYAKKTSKAQRDAARAAEERAHRDAWIARAPTMGTSNGAAWAAEATG